MEHFWNYLGIDNFWNTLEIILEKCTGLVCNYILYFYGMVIHYCYLPNDNHSSNWCYRLDIYRRIFYTIGANINGLKGHRSVGGYRASMYNAMPIESVEVLVDVMSNFASKYGN